MASVVPATAGRLRETHPEPLEPRGRQANEDERRDVAPTARAARASEPPTLELVLKRNSVERLKREKSPLGMLGELPALIAAGYADIPEEDIVRLKWWGLYHDKPKVGTFMLRIKLPAGRVTAAQLRTIGQLSIDHGNDAGELSTRQTIQLHYLRLGALPDVFARLDADGLTTAGACGDAVRNITGCPLAGVVHDELFDATPVIDRVTSFFYGNPDYSDLPRKHKITISACAHRCNAAEINCIALVGAIHEGQEGFGVLVGGGLSSVPRLGRELGVFVRKDDALDVLRALIDAWQEDLRYRVSRVKARLKFMVDDIGPEGMRAEVEKRLARTLPDFTLPAPPARDHDHMGVGLQHDGRRTVGVPVHVGLVSGTQMLALADLADATGGDVRVTRQQNLVLTGVPEEAVGHVHARLAEIGFPTDVNPIRAGSIGCTGEPHCNFSVTETKTRLAALVEGLERRFGDDVAELKLHLDGCPHACAQHWVGDIGFQGSTVRDESGTRHQAYEIYLRGGLGRDSGIGRAVFRRVRTDLLDDVVAGLVAGWLEQRRDESFPQFTRRLTDAELGELAGIDPAPTRATEEAAA
jgi:sulfite reductase beta subunit-like hemoprotein